jgi:hypothetical protein
VAPASPHHAHCPPLSTEGRVCPGPLWIFRPSNVLELCARTPTPTDPNKFLACRAAPGLAVTLTVLQGFWGQSRAITVISSEISQVGPVAAEGVQLLVQSLAHGKNQYASVIESRPLMRRGQETRASVPGNRHGWLWLGLWARALRCLPSADCRLEGKGRGLVLVGPVEVVHKCLQATFAKAPSQASPGHRAMVHIQLKGGVEVWDSYAGVGAGNCWEPGAHCPPPSLGLPTAAAK